MLGQSNNGRFDHVPTSQYPQRPPSGGSLLGAGYQRSVHKISSNSPGQSASGATKVNDRPPMAPPARTVRSDRMDTSGYTGNTGYSRCTPAPAQHATFTRDAGFRAETRPATACKVPVADAQDHQTEGTGRTASETIATCQERPQDTRAACKSLSQTLTTLLPGSATSRLRPI